MTRLAASLALLLAWALPAAAQDVAIRSGWQQDFTRLVLTVPEGADWRLGREEGGYLLDLGQTDIRYDTSTVFDRIPGTRLGGLEQGDGRLRIALVCTCHVTAFLWRADRLVIDIRDGPAPDDSPFEIALGAGAAEAPAVAADALPLPDPAPAEAPLPAPQATLPVLVADTPPVPETLLPDPFAARLADGDMLLAAERALIESIARASTQGLLDPATDRAIPSPAAEDGSGAAPQDEPASATPAAETAEDPEPDAWPGISTRTSIDRDLEGADPFPVSDASSDLACLPAAPFELGAFDESTPFHLQIGEARRALVEEFDRVPDAAATDLARRYLRFGFGSEARQALGLVATPALEQEILAGMAVLIDGIDGGAPLFADQVGCGAPAALWALLETGAIPARPELDRNSVLQYYQSLPKPVQGQIAGRLAPLFIDIGDEDAASIVLGWARAAPGSDADDMKLAEAALALHHGDPETSLRDMIATVRTDGRAGPEIFLRIYDLAEITGTPVPEDLLDLSAVLRFEYRGDPVVEELAAAEMRAHLARDDLDRALETVEDERVRLSPEGLEGLLSEAIIAMSFGLDDVAFLERMLGHLPRPISPVAENAVANRLLDLGLAAAAADVLQSTPVREAARERRYLRAEIALQLGDYDRVADLLTAMTDPRANALRAAALTERGAYDAAFALETTTAGPPELDAEAAWRAGAWSRLAESGDPDLSAASRLMLDVGSGPPAGTTGDAAEDIIGVADSDGPGPLAQGRDLLRQSEESRAVLDTVLTRFTVDPDAER